jgi:predicted GNAT family N-acyltransferase
MSSKNKFNLNDFSVKKLDDKTDLSEFDCSDNDDLGLDEFIRKEALEYQNEGMGVTHLFYNNDKIAGYITVAMGSIGVKMTELEVEIYDKKRYPALWLGRIGVHNNLRRRAVGKCMVLWCIGLAKRVSTEMGCRFIVLVTKDASRIKFYAECGFRECTIDLKEKSTRMMYFPLF